MNESLLTRLFINTQKALTEFKVKAYAVLDGAHYENLPNILKQNGINHRSLFIGQNEEMIKNGPWFIDPYLPIIEYEENASTKLDIVVDPLLQLKKIIDISSGSKSLVLWFSKFDAGTLFKHLRSVNLVLIPEEDAASHNSQKIRSSLNNKFVSAIFRHYDGNVLAETVPVMTNIQRERFLRYASGITFIAPEFPTADNDIIRWAKCPNIIDSEKQKGMLCFTHEQMEQISIRQTQRLDRRTFDYLRSVKPEEPFKKSDEELLEFVKYCRETGESIGLSIEISQWRWAYLMGLTNGTIFLNKIIVDDLKYGGDTPDSQIEQLMQDTIKSLKERKFASPKDILSGLTT